MATKYNFLKYQSIFDPEIVLYGLEKDGVEIIIDGVRYIEVTPDFKRVQRVSAESLKVIGSIVKEY